jgi:hypothetical protein
MTGTNDRLDRLERALSPTGAVLVWLTEAHAHESRIAYRQAMAEEPPVHTPLARIVEQVRTWAEREHRTGGTRARRAKVIAAVREAVLACMVAVELESATAAFADRHDPELRLALHRLISDVSECREATEDGHPCRFRHWAPDAARVAVAHVRHMREVRRRLAAEHLAGADACFPDTAERWARLERLAETIEDFLERAPVCKAARVDGVDLDRSLDDEAEITQFVEAIRDDALYETHRAYGEHEEAREVARRRLMAMR